MIERANWNKSALPAIVVILVLTAAAYAPVMFNFFVGDDFVHLTWLKDAIRNHELIWRNFHSSWLDGTTTRFYRPLISVFMVTDYLGWGINGLGFHITNVLFLLVSTLFIFLIIKEIADHEGKDSYSLLWPTGAAALFGLYPLHSEAVAWITGRVDDIVASFYLFSLWCYIRWRKSKRLGFWIGALIGMILGLLSKEMAIMLPATFVVYELFINTKWGGDKKPFAVLIGTVTPTLLFWLLLAAYFVLRRFALGTFVGGYDDSLFFISNWQAFIGGWVHGLRMLLIPVNRTLMGDHNVFTIAWEVCMAISIVLAVKNLLADRTLLRSGAFLLSWLLLCLAPVYKIFAIADDLQGSRLAFLATIPLCCLLAVAFAPKINAANADSAAGKLLPLLSKTTIAVMCSLAFFLLWRNNSVWADAGRQANAIRAALDAFYKETPGDPQVMIVGLPDQSHGAYISRNALWGMTKAPQMSRDVSNCLMVNQFEPILPFGFLKDSLLKSTDKVKVIRWHEQTAGLQVLQPPTMTVAQSKLCWQGSELKGMLTADESTQAVGKMAGDAFEVSAPAGSRKRPEVLISGIDVPCGSLDFLRLDVDMDNVSDKTGADLMFKNDLVPDFTPTERTHFEITDGNCKQIVFTLRNAPSWVLGGTNRGLKLRLPAGSRTRVKSVCVVPAPTLMPIISFKNSDYMGTKGFVHMTKEAQIEKISFDAAKIPGARGIILEITRPNLLFASQNTAELSTVLMTEQKQTGTTGSIDIRRDMFPQLGLYEARVWAVDADGKRIGVAGDHIVISVDS